MAVRIPVLVLILANVWLVVALNDNKIITHNNSLLFPGKPILDFQKYGWKIDVRAVSGANITNIEFNDYDQFPDFPFKQIGGCIFDLSFLCVQKTIAHYVDNVDRLNKITLLDPTIKIVRAKFSITPKASERQLSDESINDRIERSVSNFFDTHALRITLPKWSGKLNEVNIMYDDTNLEEGRGKKGGGGGKGGGKCKKMMMMAIGFMKMKFMGMMGFAAMKGMMMAGMSLMLSKMMLIMKLMSLKKGGGGGGGGASKEVVWVSKQGGGGGGGCCSGGGGASMDSYGAPPSTSYGVQSSGGAGYDYSGGGVGGGGGWGRSFKKHLEDYDYPEQEESTGPETNLNNDNSTSYETDDNWQTERNLTNNWNDTAPLRSMIYFPKSNVGKERNAFTNERTVTKVDNIGKYLNDYSAVNNYHKIDIKKYDMNNFAKIKSLLRRNSTEAAINNEHDRINFK